MDLLVVMLYCLNVLMRVDLVVSFFQLLPMLQCNTKKVDREYVECRLYWPTELG